MSLTTTQLVGFCWGNVTVASATATATATATGGAASVAVTTVGTKATGTSSSTHAFTVPSGGIPAGATVLIAAGNIDSRTISSVSDTKGNTYTIGSQKTGTAGGLGLAYAQNISTALVSGDVITVTFSASGNLRVMVVGYATGLTSGTLVDKNASASGTSSSPSSGATAATTTAVELVLGAMLYRGGSGDSVTTTEASGYVVVDSTGTANGTYKDGIRLAYKVVSSTGAQTYNPSLSASKDWLCIVETLKT